MLPDLIGRYVRTERPPTDEERKLHLDYGQPEDMPEGAEGTIVRVWTQDDHTWIEVEWGFAWVITPDTTITFPQGVDYQVDDMAAWDESWSWLHRPE